MSDCNVVYENADFGFGIQMPIPIVKCATPATNGVWGVQAAKPLAAVLEVQKPPQTGPGFTVGVPPTLQPCKSGEIDSGLTCITQMICDAFDWNNPFAALNCKGGQTRAKQMGCAPGTTLIDGLCY